MSLASRIFVSKCTKSDAKRDAGLEIPEDIEYIRDLRYGKNKMYNILDICWPKKALEEGAESSAKLPVIISIHGGGYVYGSKEVYQFYCSSLAEKGFAVINFNYRLAPKYKFPAPIEDLNAVIVWMMKNSDIYPFDTENVFLVGDSAGAQIACQYGVIYSDREYRKIMGFRKPKINIRALGFCCGMYNLKSMISKEGPAGIVKDYLTEKPYSFGEKLDITEYITDKYPPVYLFSSKGDMLLNECIPMAELLESRDVKCEYKIYGNEKTGHVFHVNMRDEFSDEANTDQTNFFKSFISKA
ncbi:MAG: alpha/beta hydrolase [Eubacterium sp.]|nr:alpha/beta hydrolase [Eubacterium sp.]